MKNRSTRKNSIQSRLWKCANACHNLRTSRHLLANTRTRLVRVFNFNFTIVINLAFDVFLRYFVKLFYFFVKLLSISNFQVASFSARCLFRLRSSLSPATRPSWPRWVETNLTFHRISNN